MQEKGTILIIEDHLEEKIGQFKECLDREGYDVKTAETLEEADIVLVELLKNNSLDGIILDFSFPIDNVDQSVTVDNMPSGVFLFKKYEFKINTQRIPVVINTTGDEEYKRKYLGDIKNSSTPIYNVNQQANPLAQANPEMVQEILKMFNERTEQRKIISQAKPDKKWIQRGQTGIYDKKNNTYTYLRNGD